MRIPSVPPSPEPASSALVAETSLQAEDERSAIGDEPPDPGGPSVEGRRLDEIIAAEMPLSPARVVDLLSQALSSMASRGDSCRGALSPRHIFVVGERSGERDRVHVLEGDSSSEDRCAPAYRSPEGIRGEALDGRSDVYAAGATLYEMLAGGPPFVGDPAAVLDGHLHQPPEPPQIRRLDLTVPPALEAVCLRALAKQRGDRFPSVEDMRQALLAAVDDATVRCSGCGSSVQARLADCTDCGATMADRASGPVELPLRLVGRESEIDRLLATSVGAVRVVGRPGSGRTRLVEEWCRRVEEQGGRVERMHADSTGAGRAWWPVRRVLARLLEVSEWPAPGELERARTLGALDGLREVFGVRELQPRDDRQARRRRAIGAATAELREAGAALLCEDVDRYDALSREVICRVLQDPGDRRVVVTTTDRLPLDGGEELWMKPLDAANQAAVGLRVAGDAGRWPDELEMLARARAEGLEQGTVDARRLGLPPAARAVLDAAVVAGTEIDLDLLLAVVGLPAREPAGLLAARGLARLSREKAGARLVLPSPSLRDRLYLAVDPGSRRRLHRCLLAELERRGADPELLAHHDWNGGPETARSSRLAEAARAAADALDDDGAALWLQRAALRREGT